MRNARVKIAVVTALAGTALVAAMGCSGRSQAQHDPSATTSPPSMGAGHDLILRTRTTGGIAGLGGPGSLPEFSLYADGRAIAGTRLPTEYHLTPQAYRRLVGAAFDAGLATPRTADKPGVADAMYKVITFVVNGSPRVTKIIRAGGGPDRADAFLARLDPASWPRADLTADPRPYRPTRLAVLATPIEGGGPAWPFGSLADGVRVGARTCTVLTGPDIAKAERLVTGTPQWSDHGTTYRVTLRPLLPDEPGCAALA